MDYVTRMLAGGPMVWGLLGIAAALLLSFLVFYAVPGITLWWQLRKLARRLGRLQGEPRPTLRDKLKVAFAGTRCFHAWSEFEETLHDQYDVRNGERQIRDVRATVPSEGFLNPESIIDPRLGSEFFRHLPGIFTGLGIIGTFYGLIQGLLAFDPSVDAEKLKVSLGGLFTNVEHAFMFSMAAITLAMIVTFAEKVLYAKCVRWLGLTAANLDSLFRSGLGEEYLSDLVHASQDNATQTRQLKESLVEDLKELLVGLTERQITATREMSAEIGRQIEGSLKAPLASIAETVRQASGQQTTAASATLEALMQAFIDRMQETLGGQLSGLSEMLRASTQSMGEVESTLRSLVADMQRTSSESTAGMQQAVHSLIERLQAEQQRQAQQSAAGMNDLLGKVGAAVEQIARQQESLREQSQQDLSRLTEAMQTRVDLLADSNRQAQEQGISLARTMSEVSTRAIAGMEAGANAVAEALQGVQQATARLEALTGQMTSLQGAFGDSARRLSDSSATVGGATQSLTAVVGSLGSTAQRLERLGTTIESEAAARNGMLEDIRALSSQARNTGQSLAQLTEEVHEKLAGSIAAFGDAVTKTLDQNLHAYNKQLSDAVHTLSEAFNDLAETLDVQTVRG